MVVQKPSIVNASNQGQKSAEERAAQRAKESLQIAKEAGLKAQKNSQVTWQDKWEQKRVKRTQVNGLSGYLVYESSEDDELLVDSDDDELDVEPFEYKGKDYLIDAEDTVYDVKTTDPVGEYDRENETLTIF